MSERSWNIIGFFASLSVLLIGIAFVHEAGQHLINIATVPGWQYNSAKDASLIAVFVLTWGAFSSWAFIQFKRNL